MLPANAIAKISNCQNRPSLHHVYNIAIARVATSVAIRKSLQIASRGTALLDVDLTVARCCESAKPAVDAELAVVVA